MSVETVIPLSTGYLLSLIGILISLGIIVITKMIADAFNLSKLKGWVSGEIKEFLMTLFLVAFGMFILQYIVNSIALNLLGLPGNTSDLTYPPYYFYADNFLTMMYHKVRSIGFMSVMFTVHSFIATLSSISFTIPVVPIPTEAGIIVGCIGTSPWGSLSLISNQISYVNKLWATNLLIIGAQRVFLDFIRETAFTIFFPLGVILRAFPVTRKPGSTLIALSAVFFFVYPMMVILDGYLYDNFIWGPINYHGQNITGFMESYHEFIDLNEMTDIFGTTTNLEDLTGIDMRTPTNPPQPTSQPGFFSGIWNTIKNAVGWVKDSIKNAVDWLMNLPFKLIGIPGEYYMGDKILDFIMNGGKINMYLGMLLPYRFMLNTSVIALYNLMFSLICVLINFVVTLTLFESISPLIGGEKTLMALGRLKLK